MLATIEPHEPDLLDPRAWRRRRPRCSAAKAALARAGPLRERASVELDRVTKRGGTDPRAGEAEA